MGGQGIYFKVEEASVSDAGFTKRLSFKVPAGNPLRILEISLSPDTNFIASGTFGLVVGGQTNETSGSKLPQSITIPLWAFQREVTLPNGKKEKGLILNPGETIEIYGACSSGTGLLTASVLGEII
jgi:hypothetical protein